MINRKDSGFTLIELLVVLSILALIAALVVPNVFPKLGKGRQSAARAQIELLGQALDQFRLDVGRYPTNQAILQAGYPLTVNGASTGWASYLSGSIYGPSGSAEPGLSYFEAEKNRER